jgi:hypothetical protein
LNESARKLALRLVDDPLFRDERRGVHTLAWSAPQPTEDPLFFAGWSAKASLLLAQCYRAEATVVDEDAAKDLRAKAHATYQDVYVTYQCIPDICAEAYWQAYETAKEMRDDALAAETLKSLKTHPKLQDTQRAKDAMRVDP